MRTLIIIITIMLGAGSFNAFAETTKTFVVGDDVCAPITVSVGGKSYTVYSTLTLKNISGMVTARDCSGRKLKYDFATRGSVGNSIDTYTFHNTYDVERDAGYQGNYDRYDDSNKYESARNAGRAIGSLIFSGSGGEGEAYPSLQLAPGISRAYGENLKLRYTSEEGALVYGSIGKDFLYDSEFKDKILWNVGIGSYFAFGDDDDPNMDIGLGTSIGQLAQWEKLSWMLDADYTYWIGRWRRVGIFAGGSLGWGSFLEMFNTDNYNSHGGFAWNIEAGITIRLANF